MIMELKSAEKTGGPSPPNSICDPEEKEISDEDDEDRNHKHRKCGTPSKSLERDSLEQAMTQPYRKRHRPFENGQIPQSQFSTNRDFSKRRLTGSNFSRFPNEHGSSRGRVRDFHPRFGSIDPASQMAHPGSVPSAMFPGRGLPVSKLQSASWGGFGLVPPIPNGAIDGINPLGLPGVVGPHLNPPMNMGIQRQHCRDFEELGFCLRGDMCPMEHGINRIVIEDVQSLSQFNLPVTLPSAQMTGTVGSGFVSSSVSSNTLINSRGLPSRTSKSAVDEEDLSVALNTGSTDVYDPDQPLWNNDGQETSSPLHGVQPSNTNEYGSSMDTDLSDCLVRSSSDAVGSQSASATVWGRLHGSRNKGEQKEKFVSIAKASDIPTSRSKGKLEPSGGTKGNLQVGKQINGVPFGPKIVGSTSLLQHKVGGNARKPFQKAQRTLFVNRIPLKDNKKDNLLSHFRKFGDVVDIYIPANSERAFVQFSKREEAEKALKAPDAVMGSRFIKLWWANRDSIPEEGFSAGNNVPNLPHDVRGASESSHLTVSNKGKDVVQPSDNLLTGSNEFMPVAISSPKVPPATQKKMENLELLKELRIKQEILERRRDKFCQQLDKLAKLSPGKIEVPTVAAERQTAETSSNDSKVTRTKPLGIVLSRPLHTEVSDKMGTEGLAVKMPKADSASVNKDLPNMKQLLRTTVHYGTQFPRNRYKLDNRPTTFRVRAPLPVGLANITSLRDHFSMYGEISDVEIEDLSEEECLNGSTYSEEMKNCSGRIRFTTRHAAERAFINGKSWHGHNLQLNWVSLSKPASSRSSGESSSALRGTLNAEVQSAEETVPSNHCHSSPPKSPHEPPCDSSKSTCKEKCLEPASDRHEALQVQSPEKSPSFITLEADELENRESKLLDEGDSVSDGDHQATD